MTKADMAFQAWWANYKKLLAKLTKRYILLPSQDIIVKIGTVIKQEVTKLLHGMTCLKLVKISSDW